MERESRRCTMLKTDWCNHVRNIEDEPGGRGGLAVELAEVLI